MTYFDRTTRLLLLPDRKRVLLLVAMTLVALIISLVAVQQLLIALAIAAVIPLGLAIVVWPEMATMAVMFTLFTNAAVVAVRFHHVPQSIGAAVPLLLAIPMASYLIGRREKLIVHPNLLLLLAFLFVQLLGLFFSLYFDLALDATITFIVEGILLFFLITNTVRSQETLRYVIWALLLAGLCIGGLSVFQQVTGTFDNNYWGFAQAGGAGFGTGEQTIEGEARQLRLEGPIGEKNYYAQIMLMLVPLGLFRFWGERSKLLRILALAATGFSAMGMILAFSRGGFIGLVLTIMIMVFLRYIKPYQLLILLLGMALLMFAVPQYTERLISLQDLTQLTNSDSAGVAGTDSAVQGRVGEMWAAALVFVDYPIIGVGPGMFKYYYQHYADIIGLRIHTGTREAHNLYLDLAAENGTLGLLCFAAILGVTLRGLARVRKRWRLEQPDLANMSTGLMLAIISYLTTGIFLSLAYARYFWMMIALACAVQYISNQLEAASESQIGGESQTAAIPQEAITTP
jgi:putative inorganic carbon (HCO3(-)) transporter